MQQPMESMKARVCLVGESGVGKTSLIRRFVFNEFDDRYIQTLGAKVVRKDVSVEFEGQPVHVVLTILLICAAYATDWFDRVDGTMIVIVDAIVLAAVISLGHFGGKIGAEPS